MNRIKIELLFSLLANTLYTFILLMIISIKNLQRVVPISTKWVHSIANRVISF